MNEFGRRLDDAVDQATPTTTRGFEDVLERRRRRRHRRRAALAGAAATVTVIGGVTAAGLWRPEDPGSAADPNPSPTTSTTRHSEPGPTRSEPTYTWSDEPSPVVLRLADRDVELQPWTYCWTGPANPEGISQGTCVDGAPRRPSGLYDVGRSGSVDFWFGMPGWGFEATFSEIGVDCPRRHTVDATATGQQTFRVDPAGPAGRYQVDLFGRGRGGDVFASFVWTTPEAGPVEQPEASIALVSDQDDALTSYGLEVSVQDLGFQPRHADALVTATAANGRSMTLVAERDGDDCYELGSMFFRGDDDEALDVARLGPAPFTYEVTLTFDGRKYVGTAVWPRDEKRDEAPYTILTFDPPLPAGTNN
jgi:hypothetical protein